MTCMSDRAIRKKVRKFFAQDVLEGQDHFVTVRVCGQVTIIGGVG